MSKDLNDQQAWDHTTETIKMLSLAIVQIHSILNDGGQSVGKLTDSFVHIVDRLSTLDSNDPEALAEVQNKVSQGIVAFQFYDRISQRLEHVATALNSLRDQIEIEDKRYDEASWQQLLHGVAQSYTMEHEREVFQKVMQGASVEEAIALVRAAHQNDSDNDGEVEFF